MVVFTKPSNNGTSVDMAMLHAVVVGRQGCWNEGWIVKEGEDDLPGFKQLARLRSHRRVLRTVTLRVRVTSISA